MSSDSRDMDWLNKNSLNSVTARRFAEFCKQDIATYDADDDPDKKLYQESANMILQRIAKAVSGEQK